MRYLLISCLCLFSIASSVAQPFINPLEIPDTINNSTVTLNVAPATKAFMPGVNTPTIGFNGSYLGPTIIWNKGDITNITVNNNLPEGTTVHWHGFRLPAVHDGGPHNIVDAGSNWTPSFEVLEDASTMWYHSHLHHHTLRQVNQGMAGMIIIRDNVESTYSLPRKYGVDDFPIIVQDKSFDSAGHINHMAVLGDTFMINGTLDPFLDAPAQMVRFRLLNGSVQRIFNIGFSDNRTFKMIASDAGLLESALDITRVRLAPGERVEIVVDFQGDLGDSLYLMNFASELPYGIQGGIPGSDVYPSPLNGVDKMMMKLKVGPATTNPVLIITENYTSHTKPDSNLITRNRYKELTGKAQGNVINWSINNQNFDLNIINDTVVSGSTEMWEIRNKTHFAHPFHIHEGHFFVVEYDSMPPSPENSGKKDVILLEGGITVKFIMKFDDFNDPVVPYMYHCHMLDHEDDGMMAQFLLVDSSFFTSVEPVKNSEISIYPNPARDLIRIQLESGTKLPLNLRLYNVDGKVVFSQIVDNSVIEIDLKDIPPANYFIEMKGEGRVMKSQFVRIK